MKRSTVRWTAIDSFVIVVTTRQKVNFAVDCLFVESGFGRTNWIIEFVKFDYRRACCQTKCFIDWHFSLGTTQSAVSSISFHFDYCQRDWSPQNRQLLIQRRSQMNSSFVKRVRQLVHRSKERWYFLQRENWSSKNSEFAHSAGCCQTNLRRLAKFNCFVATHQKEMFTWFVVAAAGHQTFLLVLINNITLFCKISEKINN